MEWLSENWFWTLVFIFFTGMHLFGHKGGHGCHGGHGTHDHGKHDHGDEEYSDKKTESCH